MVQAVGISLGVQYLHGKDVVHGDITPVWLTPPSFPCSALIFCLLWLTAITLVGSHYDIRVTFSSTTLVAPGYATSTAPVSSWSAGLQPHRLSTVCDTPHLRYGSLRRAR